MTYKSTAGRSFTTVLMDIPLNTSDSIPLKIFTNLKKEIYNLILIFKYRPVESTFTTVTCE